MAPARIRPGVLPLFASPLVVVGLLAGLAPAAGEPSGRRVDDAIYGHVTHVGWVVGDLDPIVAFWRSLGLEIRVVGRQALPDLVYRGQPAPTEVELALADFPGVTVAWIQPRSGDENAFTDALERRGDGIQYLGFSVADEAGLERELARFETLGVEVVQSGVHWTGRGRAALLDTAPEGGGLTLALVHDPDREPSGSPGHGAPFSKIVQYAAVVADLRPVSDYYERIGFGGLAIDPRHVFDDLEYGGRPSHYEMDVGWDRRGDVPFEWIQSAVGPNVYADVLEDKGEGFHHLAFPVEDMDAAIRHFEALGVGVSQSGAWNFPTTRGRFAYLDTDDHGGVSVELLWNDPSWPR